MRRRTKVGAMVVGAAAAAAAVAARIAARSNDVPSTVHVPADPSRELDVDGEAFLDHLGAAIRIDTTVFEDQGRNTLEPILAFHDFLIETYPLVHRHCAREVINEGSLLYTWQGADDSLDPIVLMAHQDVVPIEPGTEDDWQVEPFSGARADGYVWGRGALDDKGPLIGVLEAVEHLLATGFTPTRSVVMVFGHDEEIGGTRGAKHVARELRSRGITPWFVLDEGGGVVEAVPGFTTAPSALVKVAEKGYISLELTARGDGGHSSIPPASSAIGKLAVAIERLERNPMPARIAVLQPFFDALTGVLDRRVRALVGNLRVTGPAVARVMAARKETNALIRTTTAVTMVSGGVKPNVLPQEAHAVVNFRILEGDTIQGVKDHVARVVGPDIGIEETGAMRAEPSRRSSTDSHAWEVVRSAVEETFPGVPVAPWTLTGATDSRYFIDFSGDVYGFGPFTLDFSEPGLHGTDERVRESDAEAAVSFFARVIRRACA